MPVLVLIVLALALCGPFIVIWGLNTLFPILQIPYTFWTWLAVLAVGALFKADVSSKSSTSTRR